MKYSFTHLLKVMIIFLLTFNQLSAQEFMLFDPEGDMSGDAPQRVISDGGSTYVEIEYHFPGAYLLNKSHGTELFQEISVEGFSHMEQAGKPALPAHNDHIAVPVGATVSVEMLSFEVFEIDGFNIYPALRAARDTYGADPPEFEMDEETYSSNAFFPAQPVEIIDIQTYKDCPLAIVQIRPVQFNPVTGVIKVYSNLAYRVIFSGGSHFAGDENTPASNQMIRNVVINPSSIPEGQVLNNTNRTNARDYIIITHSAYLDAADSLANWKRQLGYSVEVVSQSSWNTTQVKDAIQTRYNNWTPHPQYFVIIGDHAGTYAVPGEIHYDVYYNEPFATDLYYACMDGAGDHYPDLAHGRISVSNPTQAMQVVMKNIEYERNPVNNSNFYNNALNCAQFQDDDNDTYADRRFTHTSEEIRDYIVSKGYGVDRVYATTASNPTYYNNGFYSPSNLLLPSDLRDPGFNWSGGSSDITANINAGRFYVFHRDHGYVGGSGWSKPYYTTGSISGLSNGDMLPIVFSINCHTGEYQLNECFAEKFIRHSGGGAVGVVAAAYYSFSGYNDALSCGMIDAIWSNPGLIPSFGAGGISNPSLSPHGDIFTMGDVVNQGKIRMTETWSGASTTIRYQFELFHYFGDPALKIWTAPPGQITANIPSNCNEGSIPISGCNVQDALATAFANGTLIGSTTLSGGSGTINFPVQPDGTQLTITLSKHNYKPLQQVTTVQAGLTFTPVADFIADVTTISEGDTVHFTDLSQNSPTSWSWSFEGGVPSTSSLQNPVVTYPSAGTYDVTLTVTNNDGSDTKTELNLIIVTMAPPIAQFEADNIVIMTGEQVNFTDHSLNNPSSWSWSFQGGNPGNSTNQHPAVTYDSAGIYEVSLSVTNPGGSHTLTRTAYITVTNNFYCPSSGWAMEEWIEFVQLDTTRCTSGSSGESGYQDLTGHIFNLTEGSVVNLTLAPGFSPKNKFEYWRVWIDYNGDGDFLDVGEYVFSAEKKRSSVSGTFTVPAGLNLSTRMRVSMDRYDPPTPCHAFAYGEVEDYTVHIWNPNPQPPVADFSANVTTVTEGGTVHFSDLSLNNPTAWSWTFHGGSPVNSSNQNPSIVYNTAGTYDVTLTATNAEGSDTHTKTAYITVTDSTQSSSYCEPVAIDNSSDFINSVTIGTLSNSSGQGSNGYTHYLTPSFNFAAGSSYDVTLAPYVSSNRNFWRIWIDFNGDGDFDDSDESVLFANSKKGSFTDVISIPSYANGSTRMRISMETGSAPAPCDDGFPGEVEDYDVVIGAESHSLDATMPGLDYFTVYPNPVKTILNINVTPSENIRIRIMDMLGQTKVQMDDVSSSTEIDVSDYPPGFYMITLSTHNESVTKKFIKR